MRDDISWPALAPLKSDVVSWAGACTMTPWRYHARKTRTSNSADARWTPWTNMGEWFRGLGCSVMLETTKLR